VSSFLFIFFIFWFRNRELALERAIEDNCRPYGGAYIQCGTPLKGFPVNFCFNQFSVEREGGWSVLSVGYLLKGRLLDDVLSYAVSQEAIEVL
jgi:hypothetical protein